MQLKFSKMHGLGNDFMVIDGLNQAVQLNPQLIRAWADRHFGVGFDQLLLVEASESSNAQFKYRIFNADGGEVAQCGNGARCFARFVREKGLTDAAEIAVETLSGLLQLNVIDAERVEVNMGIPEFDPPHIPLETTEQKELYRLDINEESVTFSALSLGNPHAVIQVENIDDAPVASMGRAMQAHPFFPESVNVGFMQVTGRDSFRLRVFERGVGETLACGSGACAAMIAGRQLDLLDSRAIADLTGGKLQLNWQGVGNPVMMTGGTTMVYEGVITV